MVTMLPARRTLSHLLSFKNNRERVGWSGDWRADVSDLTKATGPI